MRLFSRTDQSFLGRWWWTIDHGLLGAVFVLIIFGLVLVTAASPSVASHLKLGDFFFLKRHVFWLVPSVVGIIGVSMLERRYVWRLASIVFLGSIIAMLLVLFVGTEIKGAQRWLHIFGFSIQPSEFVKPAFAIVAAWLMALEKEREKFPGHAWAVLLYFLTIFLLLLQPDLGMTVVVTFIMGAQILLAGFRFRLLIGCAGLGIGGLVGAYYFLPHVQSRIDRFFDPQSGDTFQVDKSLEAFQNGGFWGTGPGQGTVKLSLPDAHADFIFSVAGEELGLIFVLVLMAVYGFILLRGFNRLMDSRDMFVVLAVGGILTMFGLQALVHMGSSLGVIPTKGMTLPFVSYGGSSMLALSYAFGSILALTRKQRRKGISRAGLSKWD